MTDLTPALSAPAGRAQRLDGWTPDRQRAFLEAVSEGHTVEAACRIVGLSVASAYALRRRASGAAFAIGWQAACLQARERLADILLSRAIDGQTETITRANGDVIERHRHDNRLATAMLTRLDRLADTRVGEGTHQAARMVAQEFDAFLDLIERDAGPARAGLFLGARAMDGEEGDLDPVIALGRADRWLRSGAALAGEVDVADLDPAMRDQWTADQWARAEAAGLVQFAVAPAPACAPPDADGNPQLPQLEGQEDADADADAEPRPPVWWDEDMEMWSTSFPPPPGFDGFQEGQFGDPDYERALSPEEEAVAEAPRRAAVDARRIREAQDRDHWFGFVPEPPDPAAATARAAAIAADMAEGARNDATIERLHRMVGLYDAYGRAGVLGGDRVKAPPASAMSTASAASILSAGPRGAPRLRGLG
ncbi:hypothetical protein [Sphingomonas sp. KC8]|uniref:hypothetical protein n=1 Tax=Sphingomonas sp. KC8 TaxID=1030157 RepID=UPI0002488A1A|nr:hypothetical protein [Sphingomonas sp. KC8]ARS27330.1 hypothetical protein KC8_08495 [Sphingomonas sp. KC8]